MRKRSPALVLDRQQLVVISVLTYAGLVVLLCARAIASGSTVELLAAFGAALAPPLCYAALRWPLLVPFCLYICAIPFDTLATLHGIGSVTKLMGLLAAGAFILRLLVVRNPVPPPRALFWWAAFLLWSFTSALWAMSPAESTNPLGIYVSLLALYAVLAVMPVTALELRAILAATALSGTLAGLVGIWLFHRDPEAVNQAGRVIIAAGENHLDQNNFALSLIVPLAIVLWFLVTTRALVAKCAALAGVAVLFAGFGVAGSRGAMLAVLGMLVWILIRSRHRILAAATIACLSAAAFAVYPNLLTRMLNAGESGGAGRTGVWQVGLRAFRDHWLLGAGIGNFVPAFNVEYLHTFMLNPQGWYTPLPAHNVYLQVAVELGVAGFVLFAITLAYQARVLRLIPKGSEHYELRIFVEAALAGLLIAATTENMLNQKLWWFAFELMLILRGRVLSQRREVAPLLHHEPAVVMT